MADRLRDHATAEFVVTTSAAPERPAPGAWTVLVDAGGWPVAALPPGGATPVAEIVVAEADLPVAEALRAPALEDLAAECPVVCVSGGRVVGVWAGDDLLDALMRGPTRSVGSDLPGEIRIPLVSRRCRFTEDAARCLSPLTVPEKPETMPPCRNTAGLAAHAFVW
jgi:hypothetical protein